MSTWKRLYPDTRSVIAIADGVAVLKEAAVKAAAAGTKVVEHKPAERPAGYRYGAFVDWLEQFREDKTIFGQLRRFIERDVCWPELSSYSAYRAHLKAHFAAPVAIEALRVAHRLYLESKAS